MTTWYSAELTGIDSLPVNKPNAINGYNAIRKRFRATITLASQQVADIIHIARFPAGSMFEFGLLNTSVTLTTSTLSIGVTGNTTKYLSSGTLTTANTPTIFAAPVTDESMSPYTAEEQIFITVGVLALPASGTLVVDLFVSHPC